ncbi:MAG: MBL fold metallo-hydrolase RNA specificity domain-containing protein [Flavobacteriales bacterium]
MDKVKVYFLGAAGTVTGSKFLIEAKGKRILVDCGLFQGVKKLRELNWNYLPVEAATIDCVLLTHGHMDHSGFLPRLVDMGFKKWIYGTAPTIEIAEIILCDSAKIQEEDAERANKKGFSKHHPARPLYNLKDVENTLPHFKSVEDNYWLDLGANIKVRFSYAGHILGAASVEIDVDGKMLVFSGDVGREDDLMLYPPIIPPVADFLFIESTYGDRLHPDENIEAHLQQVVCETIEMGGTLIIPSFAVERAQLLMCLLWQLKQKGKIPHVPMIVDSPMGTNVLKVLQHHLKWLKLSEKDCSQMCASFDYTKDFKETLAMINDERPKIVIAGSGMLTGGRVLSYLQHYIGDPRTTVLMSGYQAEGTRGRQLLRGASEIKIYGRYYDVKARIEEIRGLSGHADQKGLLSWMSKIRNKPQKVFIVHGEAQAADVLRTKIESTLKWNCIIPSLWQIEEL